MKLIKPSATLITETDPWKKIEYIGRVCYKSEDKIAEGTAKKFVKSAINRKHFAILEHARLTYEITGLSSLPAELINSMGVGYTYKRVDDSVVHYLTVSMSHIFQNAELAEDATPVEILFHLMYIAFVDKFDSPENQEPNSGTASLHLQLDDDTKVILSVKLLEDNKTEILNYDALDHNIHDSLTFKFICDRGVTHELVRHRGSFAQESTRYCNYTLGKFGSELTFIEPADYADWGDEKKEIFTQLLEQSEEAYNKLVESGATPQEARAVLPNALKAEIVMTLPIWQWKHFFSIRYFGTTGAPHPDMKVIAGMAYDLVKEQL